MGLDADRIEKAAIAIFVAQTNWATSNPDNRQIREWWDAQPDMVKDATRRLARAALESQTGEPDPLEWADADMETLDGRRSRPSPRTAPSCEDGRSPSTGH